VGTDAIILFLSESSIRML